MAKRPLGHGVVVRAPERAPERPPAYGQPPSWIQRNMRVIVAIGVLVALAFLVVGMYNSFIAMNEEVTKQWQNVEVQYQRRVDLVPNLVTSVASYATLEASLLQNITELRSQWARSRTSGDAESGVAAARGLDSAISRLLLVAENYPQLRSSELYRDLQAQLEGAENRISVERTRYNQAVRNYNTAVKSFPGVLLAGAFGFRERSYFEAAPGADVAPRVGGQTALP
jgi:LemA protein